MNTSNITDYKPKEFAELLNVTVKMFQRWDREKILVANRTPTNRRYYTYVFAVQGHWQGCRHPKGSYLYYGI